MQLVNFLVQRLPPEVLFKPSVHPQCCMHHLMLGPALTDTALASAAGDRPCSTSACMLPESSLAAFRRKAAARPSRQQPLPPSAKLPQSCAGVRRAGSSTHKRSCCWGDVSGAAAALAELQFACMPAHSSIRVSSVQRHYSFCPPAEGQFAHIVERLRGAAARRGISFELL